MRADEEGVDTNFTDWHELGKHQGEAVILSEQVGFSREDMSMT